MTSSLGTAAVLIVHALRWGPLRVSAYGLCAALGLVLAMALVRRCARRVGVDPERAWDAGVFAIISCFVASRLLLVMFDAKAFLKYPVLVLSLPSLTYAGMALAAVMVWVYLWRKRMSVLLLLDVFAAPAAVLAAMMELGNYLDASEVGMPTRLPWGVRDPWSAGGERVHPVALYGVVASLVLGVVLWRLLGRRRARLGGVAAWGLLLGGMLAFGLDTLTQPAAAVLALWIEPGQWVAVVAMLAGAALWSFAPLQWSGEAVGVQGALASRRTLTIGDDEREQGRRISEAAETDVEQAGTGLR